VTRFVVGIDIGGSGTRAVLARLDPGGPVAVGTAEVAEPLRVGTQGIQVDHLVERVVRVAGALPRESVATAAIGCAGLVTLGEAVRELLPEAVARCVGTDRVILCPDLLTSYLGGLGWQPGAVVAAGTGAVALGTDLRGRWRRVDGWGYLVGDSGGGSWIGRYGLDAALRAHDGRTGGSPLLLDRLRYRFGEPAALARELACRPERAALLASFAPEVLAAADGGDARSVEIVGRAGTHLAESVVAALLPGGTRITALGGPVTASRLLSGRFAAEVHALRPDVEVCAPAGTGVDGAVLLAAAGDLPSGSEVIGAQLTRHTAG
jgi:N-acetylglucosamine kinase-like BadF-type ATPase